ncbi:hypothetical protein GN956_G8818 [Arapaima gigas]
MGCDCLVLCPLDQCIQYTGLGAPGTVGMTSQWGPGVKPQPDEAPRKNPCNSLGSREGSGAAPMPDWDSEWNPKKVPDPNWPLEWALGKIPKSATPKSCILFP